MSTPNPDIVAQLAETQKHRDRAEGDVIDDALQAYRAQLAAKEGA